MNSEKGLHFLKLLYTMLDIRLPNYELKIAKVLNAFLCQLPIHKALATLGLRNAVLT